jgi:hypothetical protein
MRETWHMIEGVYDNVELVMKESDDAKGGGAASRVVAVAEAGSMMPEPLESLL